MQQGYQWLTAAHFCLFWHWKMRRRKWMEHYTSWQGIYWLSIFKLYNYFRHLTQCKKSFKSDCWVFRKHSICRRFGNFNIAKYVGYLQILVLALLWRKCVFSDLCCFETLFLDCCLQKKTSNCQGYPFRENLIMTQKLVIF